MDEQAKMQRMLQMLMLLSGSRRYSIAELMERFEVSESTIRRSLKCFKEAGFFVEQNQGYYQLNKNGQLKTLEKLLHFSEEEACILWQTLEQIEPHYTAKKQLILKLNTLYNLKVLARSTGKKKIEIVRILKEAVEGKKQLLLKKYKSSNSDRIADRPVEPFCFSAEYETIWCLDTDSKSVKQFKISRIGEAELIDQPWQYAHLHNLPFTDAFRMSAEATLARVTASLTLKAYNLLVEEYPLASQHITPVNSHYHLDIEIADFNGVGRFVLGLAGEVWDVQPDAFQNFLQEKIKNYQTVSS